jgi:predicted amidohydrolase YtcJ
LGYIDYHAHVYGTGYKVLYPKLDNCTSIADVQKVVLEVGQIARPERSEGSKVNSQNILLRGWDQNKWGASGFPTKEDIDEVESDLPVALIRIDGHAMWCNSAMLQFAGITADTLSPNGGEIQHGGNGEPNGILIDEAMSLVYDKLPPHDDETLKNILCAGLHEFAKHHIGVHDMGIPAEWWEPYKKLYKDEGDSLITSYVFLDMTKPTGKQLFLDKVKSGEWDDSTHPNLKLVGIKLYLDGALGSRGAHLFEDYSDDPGNCGIRLMDDEEALMLMKLAAERELQIAVHAIGDAANARALDLFQKVREHLAQQPKTLHLKPVLRIEHAQIVREEDVVRFKEIDVWAIIQPQFWTSDHEWALHRLGAQRMKNAYRWRSLIEAGVKVAASSDSPVEDANCELGIRTLCEREREGVEWDIAVSLYEAMPELLR